MKREYVFEDDFQEEYVDASVIERVVTALFLPLSFFAFAVSNAAEVNSISEKSRAHYDSLRDDSREQLYDAARIVFKGKKPIYL